MPQSLKAGDASEGASSIPPRSGELAFSALLAASLVTLYALWTGNVVRGAAVAEGHHGVWLETVLWLGVLAAVALFNVLGTRHPLTQKHRRALEMALF